MLWLSFGGKVKSRVWAKHLARKTYKLWFSYCTNRKGQYLALMCCGKRNVKRTFFRGGFQGRGWWNLIVAAFPLYTLRQRDQPIDRCTETHWGKGINPLYVSIKDASIKGINPLGSESVSVHRALLLLPIFLLPHATLPSSRYVYPFCLSQSWREIMCFI